MILGCIYHQWGAAGGRSVEGQAGSEAGLGTCGQNPQRWWSASWGHGCPILQTTARKACGVVRGREGGGDREEQDRQAGRWEGAFPVTSDRDPQLRLLTPTPDLVTLAARGSQDAQGEETGSSTWECPLQSSSGSLGLVPSGCPLSAGRRSPVTALP